MKEDFHPLLGADAIQKMALITVNNEKFKMVAKVSQVNEFISQHSDSIINEFEDDVKEAEYIPVTERRLLELNSATKEDRSMQQLQQVIVEGWPEDKIHLDPEVRPYFSMRNEMTVQDGLIFRGNRVVVPMTQRAVLKEKLHSTHLGIEGCCRRARECLYWPNMNSDIRDCFIIPHV